MANNTYSPSIRFVPAPPLDSMSFDAGSIEEYITTGLAGKMVKPGLNYVALKLGYMINSFSNRNGATIEERAVNREVGLRIAEYFADAFIDKPFEVQSFTDGLKGFAYRDILMEKGYYFWEGQAYELYRPVPNSIIYKRSGTSWGSEAVEAFRAYEQKVASTISEAIKNLDNDIVANTLNRILAEYSLISNPTHDYDIPCSIQWFVEMRNRLNTI